MTISEQQDHFRLQWDLYRLTSGNNGYEVLSAVILLTVSQGRREADIQIAELTSTVQCLRARDAHIYGNPIPAILPEESVTEALHELAFRRVVSLEPSPDRYFVVTPLIKTWKDLPSVRLDNDGQPVRTTA